MNLMQRREPMRAATPEVEPEPPAAGGGWGNAWMIESLGLGSGGAPVDDVLASWAGEDDSGPVVACEIARAPGSTTNHMGLGLIEDKLRSPPDGTIMVNDVAPADIVALGFREIAPDASGRRFVHPRGHVVHLGRAFGKKDGGAGPEGGDTPGRILPDPYGEMAARKATVRDKAKVAASAETRWRAMVAAGASYGPDDADAVTTSGEAIRARHELRAFLNEALGLEETWIDEIHELEDHGEAAQWETLRRSMEFFNAESNDNEQQRKAFLMEFEDWVGIEHLNHDAPLTGDEWPDLELPDLTQQLGVPQIEIPEIEIPEVELPGTPDFEVPDLDMPDFDVPDLDMPDFD